jgi:hypothetical protein
MTFQLGAETRTTMKGIRRTGRAEAVFLAENRRKSSLLYLAGFVLVRCNRQGNWGSDWFGRGKAGTQSVQVGEEEMESSGWGAAVLTLLGRAVRPAGGSHGDGGAASFF